MENNLPSLRDFSAESLSHGNVKLLEEAARKARIDVLTMVTLAESGHPAGSLSSLEMYLTTYGVANLTQKI